MRSGGGGGDDDDEVRDATEASSLVPPPLVSAMPPPPPPTGELHRKRRSSIEGDTIDGYMLLHVKKPRRKLFAGGARPAFYVVADARKSVLEVFSNESRSERIYALSLAGARLGFEADDADVVLDKCFCVEVRAWKKRNTLSLKHQSFVFFEENQLRMLRWVKCIHLAIKFSSDHAADRELFRTSNASDRPPSSDDNDEELRQSASGCDRNSDSAADANAADACECSGHGGTAATMRKRLVIDPSAPVAAPKEPKTPLDRLNAMFHNNKQLRSPKSPSGSDFSGAATSCYSTSSGNGSAAASSAAKPLKESKTVAAVACALLSPKILSSSSASTASSSSAAAKYPFYSSKASVSKTGGANGSSRSYGIHSPFSSASDSNMATRKRDERTSGSALSSAAAAANFSDDAHFGDFRSTRLREYAIPPKIQRHRSSVDADDESQSESDGSGSGTIAASQTLDNKMAFILSRLMVLWVAFLGGAVEASIFLPIAAAGVFAHVCQLQDEQFTWAALAMVWVFFASRFQGTLGGIGAIAIVLYFWCYAEFKNQRRIRRVRVAAKLLHEERENFPHVDIPNWICHPDVDRVEWLNNVLIIGWPYMKLAIRNSLMGSLNPLLDSVRPAFMSSLSLVRVDLGEHTPHISGVKFVNANPLTEEVTLDVAVRVVADESLVAELRMVSNLGAAAVVSLRDLFLVGTLRVTLNPLCVDWPCFSALSLSFTDRPVFDFSLTAAKINISNVPFASEWLHTFLHDLLNDYFVWPRVVHIPLWDENAPAVPPAAATASPATTSAGQP